MRSKTLLVVWLFCAIAGYGIAHVTDKQDDVIQKPVQSSDGQEESKAEKTGKSESENGQG